MKADIQIKIKTDKGKDIILDEKEAKELFEKLGEIFSKDTTYVPVWIEKNWDWWWKPVIPNYPNPWWTEPWYTGDSITITNAEDYTVWNSSDNSAKIEYKYVNQ